MPHSELMLRLAVTSLEPQVPTEGTLEERLLASMRYVRKHQHDLFWIGSYNDELMLRTALAGVLLQQRDEDLEAITEGLAPLKALSALMDGVPVDMMQVKMEGVLPIMKLWLQSSQETPA